MKRTLSTGLAAAAMLAGSICANAATVQLISNGDFEIGSLAGWSVTDLAGGSGTWFANSGITAPLSGNTTVGAAAGTFYAVTDQVGAGTHVLEQSFVVPLGATSVILMFDMFINDQSGVGPIVDPSGLDHTGAANQHARVDIMASGAGAFSTAALDIVATLVAPSVDAGANPHAYTNYLFDLTGIALPGGTYKLRFGEVDNQFFFNQGVDNVSISVQVGNVPEPSGLALVALALAGLATARRKASR